MHFLKTNKVVTIKELFEVNKFRFPAPLSGENRSDQAASSQILSIKDRRNGIGKPVFKLAPLGSGQTLMLVAPDLCVPGVSPDVLQRVLSQDNKSHV